MGNQIAQADIQYRTQDGKHFNIKGSELKKDPKDIPSKDKVNDMFNGWMNMVIMDQQTKTQLKDIPIKYKFSICQRHKYLEEKQIYNVTQTMILKENNANVNSILQNNLALPLDQIKIQGNYIQIIIAILELFQPKYQEFDIVEVLLNNRFIEKLLEILRKQEIKSRKTRTYGQIITILKLLKKICDNNKYLPQIGLIEQFFNVLCTLFHPIQSEMSILSLTILSNFVLSTPQIQQYLYDGMISFQQLYRLDSKFTLHLNTLYRSENLLFILHIINYLHKILQIQSKNLIEEFYQTTVDGKHIDDICKTIELRLQTQQYQIEKCTYAYQYNQLKQFQHPLEEDLSNSMIFNEQTSYKQIDEAVQFKISEAEVFNRFYLENHEKEIFIFLKARVKEFIQKLLNIEYLQNIILQPNIMGTNFFYERKSESTNYTATQNQSFDSDTKVNQLKDQIKQLRLQLNKQSLESSDDDESNEKEIQCTLLTAEIKMTQNMAVQTDPINLQGNQDQQIQISQVTNSNIKPPPPPPQMKAPLPPPPPPSQIKPPGPPPPPGPPGKTGPPPPPPPGGIKLPPGAPPPPLNKAGGRISVQKPLVDVPTASVPLKPFNWNIISAVNIKGDNLFTVKTNKKIILQLKEIDEMFPKATQKQTQGLAQLNIPQKISLLSSERSKNIEIVLGKLKLKNEIIVNALQQLDLEILNNNTIQSLISILPTSEEEKSLQDYVGEKQELAIPEQFLMSLRQVSYTSSLLNALKVTYSFEENSKETQRKADDLLKVLKKLQNQQRFIYLFQIALQLGNYMNYSNNKQPCLGFKMDSLIKATDIKSVDGKFTLFGYIVQETENYLQTEFLTIDETIFDYEIVEKLPISQLFAEISDLKKAQFHVKQVVIIENQKIKNYFVPFLEMTQQTIKQIENTIDQVQNEYQKTATFFCENPKDPSDKFGEKLMKIFFAIQKFNVDRLRAREQIKRQLTLKFTRQTSPKNEDKKNNIQMFSARERTITAIQFPSK
ncbi:Formin Homology 2 Domain [Paramecium bursaria]